MTVGVFPCCMAVGFNFMSKSEWEDLNKTELSNFESYDRALVIFLTSTFGFSLLAVSYIVNTWGNLCHGWFLLIGWTILALAIALFLLNFYLTHRGIESIRNDITNKQPHAKKLITLRSKVVRINWIVGVMYLLGVSLIISFVALNMPLS